MSRQTEIVGIQYLRGLCSAAVVIDHVSAMAASPKYLGRTVLNGALEHGAIGVDIFFVISGFIITVTALQGSELAPSLRRSSYFVKRFARIVPLMWLAIASHFAMRIGIHSTELVPSNYLRAAALWPDGLVEPSPIWTLRHELLFYIMFAVTFLGRRYLRAGLVIWCLAPILLAAISGRITNTHDDMHFWQIVFSPANIEFGAGVLVGIYWLRAGSVRLFRTPVHPFVIFAVLTTAVIIASAMLPFVWMSVPNAIFTATGGSAVVWLATRIDTPTDWLSTFGRLLGNASYSVYLFHMHVAAILLRAARSFPTLQTGTAIVAIACCSIMAGIVIHLLIEKPVVQKIQRLLAPRPASLPLVVRGP